MSELVKTSNGQEDVGLKGGDLLSMVLETKPLALADNDDRVKPIKLLILDVDGVLTDGAITYTNTGDESKTFSAKDGLGIVAAQKAGLTVAVITGRKSDIVRRRMTELGVSHLYMGVGAKAEVLKKLLQKLGLQYKEIAYIGDDLNDLAIMQVVGLAMAPADAVLEVQECAHKMLTHAGGHGAVREGIEYILKKQGRWAQVLLQYKRERQIKGQ
ncbi:MAG: HAD-IIIA family hydrolase [Veillonellaceae bacterium]|nr:HAD-IIIA family hydrolase [Veillonellaceae bacterium]